MRNTPEGFKRGFVGRALGANNSQVGEEKMKKLAAKSRRALQTPDPQARQHRVCIT